MSEVQVQPIFNQSEPGVFQDFLRIRVATMSSNYNWNMPLDECERVLKSYEDAWKGRTTNFAFGAYDDKNQMVGFIRGDCIRREVTIRDLYILPEYQGQKIGYNLLKNAEAANMYCGNYFRLVSLYKSQDFYKKYGYTPLYQGSNEYEKQIGLSGYSKVVPVFYPEAKSVRALKNINADFDTRIISKQHTPMLAYLDFTAKLRAYWLGQTQNGKITGSEIKVAQHEDAAHIIKALNNEATKLISFYNSKTK